MPSKIELLKVRDFGEVITDTLIFARQNFKQLIKCFFVFCGFFMLAGAFLLELHQSKLLGGMTNDFGESRSIFSQAYAALGPDYWIGIAFLLVGYVSLQVTVLSYLAIYKEKGNIAPTVEEVWGYIKYFFLRVFGSAILIAFLLFGAIVIVFILIYAASSSNTYVAIFLTAFLCIVPFVYIYPIFSLIFPTMVFENGTFGYAFGRSFRLIKNNWWTTFGAIMVMGLIIGFASYIVLVPAIILEVINLLMHFRKGTSFSITIAIITAVLQALSHMLYMLPVITISLCYFSHTERLEGEGLLSRLSRLGTPQPIEPEENEPEDEDEL